MYTRERVHANTVFVENHWINVLQSSRPSKDFNPSKEAGSDRLSLIFVVKCSEVLNEFLFMNLNALLSTGYLSVL